MGHTDSILAPINKKSGAGPTGKSGTGVFGKNSNNKPSGKSSGNIIGLSSGGKSSGNKSSSSTPKASSGFGVLGSSSSGGKTTSLGASSSKSYSASSYSTPKSKKSSTGFGILWIPTKKRNKHKDIVYTSHNESSSKRKYERTPSMYNFMSGDSPDFKPHKKKEETDLLMPDRSKAPLTSIASASTAVTAPDIPTDNSEKPEEKQEFIQRDKGDTKDAAGDTNDRDFKNDKGDDYLENDKVTNKSDKQENEKYGDKVDSVYLRPPPAHKARSNASTVEEEDCGIKCLYYTLQCCDCVLM